MVGLTHKRWSVIGSLGILIAINTTGLAVISQHNYSINKRVLVSKNALLTISELEGNLKDAETGQRGFILTGDKDYLQPYIVGVGAAKANLAKLEKLSTNENENDSLARSTIEDIKNFSNLKFEELEQTISLRQSGGLESALPVIKSGTGKTYMDFIRQRSLRLRFLEETKLNANLAIADQLNRVRTNLLIVAILSSGIICFLLIKSFREELTLRQNIEDSQVARLEALRTAADLKEKELSLRIHDWKNPLTGIMISVEILAKYNDTLSPEKRQVHFKRILNNSTLLLNGFNDALLVARAEAGRLDPSFESADIVTICKNSINAVELKVPEGRSINLYTVVLRLLVTCDGSLLQRSIVNLLENALKHTNKGEIAICISKRSEWVIIQVADQGDGIPPEDLSRLFKGFERGNTKAEGTGLGLAVVKSCADAHNGWVKVESNPTGGGLTLEHPDSSTYTTVFTLALPAALRLPAVLSIR
jgi:signal transduction histidine kinase